MYVCVCVCIHIHIIYHIYIIKYVCIFIYIYARVYKSGLVRVFVDGTFFFPGGEQVTAEVR